MMPLRAAQPQLDARKLSELIADHGPWSFEGFNLYADVHYVDPQLAAAAMRRARQMASAHAKMPMRIAVTARLTDDPNDEPFLDTCVVFGWRAAGVAARALRHEYREDSRQLAILVSDPVLSDAWDTLWCPLELRQAES